MADPNILHDEAWPVDTGQGSALADEIKELKRLARKGADRGQLARMMTHISERAATRRRRPLQEGQAPLAGARPVLHLQKGNKQPHFMHWLLLSLPGE